MSRRKTSITFNPKNELDKHCMNILACVKDGQRANFIKMAIYNYGRSRIRGLENLSSTVFEDDDELIL